MIIVDIFFDPFINSQLHSPLFQIFLIYLYFNQVFLESQELFSENLKKQLTLPEILV